IQDPIATIQLQSPRNGLIPERLFSILSDICAAHGRDFDFVMSLPLLENGLSTEDAHPRFVACLLRLGDLLDLDNHRFCPTMLSAFGSVPGETMAHIEKHAAIKHFFVGPRSIQVTAECDTAEGYSALQRWLGWLSDEIKDQTGRWPQIMPEGFPGTLPTFSECNIKAKNYEAVTESKATTFSLNIKQAQELFFGENIYKDEAVFIRELLQNSVDASLIAAWLDFEQYCRLSPNLNNSQDLRADWINYIQDCMERYTIQVVFKKIGDISSVNQEIWRISITDRGIGIDEKDVPYMKETLGSSKNKRKMDIINKMPVWARPAGAFGLGLQSVFQVTEELVVESKSKFSTDAYRFEFCNPTGKYKGRILAQRLNHFQFEHGTKLEFEMKFDS
ncbi:HD domain-containing protein, partial [Leptospira idonii]|uniref:HD domain-containing protein n=1 Tax=Leptospira idonii TaxID=1193500 RepID=UPI003CCC6B37